MCGGWSSFMSAKRVIFVVIWLCITGIAQGDTTQPAGQSKTLASPFMVEISAGAFTRADGRHVELSSFSLSSTEVPWDLWHAVENWGETHGYDLPRGSGQATLPVGNISWFDATKWCNA